MKKQLKRDGWARLGSVFSADEMQAFAPAIIAAADRSHARCLMCESADDLSNAHCVGCERTRQTPPEQRKSFIRAHNLHRTDPRAAEFVRSPRLAKLAADLLGVESVRLYKDTAFFKVHLKKASPCHSHSSPVAATARQPLT
jgi:hypothetical protein